jgi:protein-tyrosine phosphatase
MAQAMFTSSCNEARVEAESAGLSASDGERASVQSIKVMREYGISLDSHRARRLTPELVSRTDIILVMTRAHLLHIRRAYPEEASKTFLLSGFPEPWPHGRHIEDPIGQPVEVYRKSRDAMTSHLGILCKEISKFLN